MRLCSHNDNKLYNRFYRQSTKHWVAGTGDADIIDRTVPIQLNEFNMFEWNHTLYLVILWLLIKLTEMQVTGISNLCIKMNSSIGVFTELISINERFQFIWPFPIYWNCSTKALHFNCTHFLGDTFYCGWFQLQCYAKYVVPFFRCLCFILIWAV